MSSLNVTTRVDEHVPEVPGILKRLVRSIAYTFYQPCHIAIFNVLLRHIVVDEDSLSLLVKIDKKQLRSMILPLKSDRLIKQKILKEKMEESGQYLSFTYYYINYHLFLNVVKYKLESMKRKIVNKEDSNRLRPCYTCSNCTRGFTDLDMDRLINMKTGELTCYMCYQPVYENEESKQQLMSRTLLAKFNQQFNYLYKLVDKCCSAEFDDKLIEPAISRFQIDRAIISRNSADTDIVEAFYVNKTANAKTKRLLANTVYQQQLTIKFDDDSNGVGTEMMSDSNRNKIKEFPEWLKHTTPHINSESNSFGKFTTHLSTDSKQSPLASTNNHSKPPLNGEINKTNDGDIIDDIDELLQMEMVDSKEVKEKSTNSTEHLNKNAETNNIITKNNNDVINDNYIFNYIEKNSPMDNTVIENHLKNNIMNPSDFGMEYHALNGTSSCMTLGGATVPIEHITNDMLQRMTTEERQIYNQIKKSKVQNFL